MPNLGLVCITHSEAIRYRTLQLSRYRTLNEKQKLSALQDLYRSNLKTLLNALEYCHQHSSGLYRVTASLFPLSDLPDQIGKQVLMDMAQELSKGGPQALRLGIRVVLHPDQFVVLNSLKPEVALTSRQMLEHQAWIFDLLGLPRSNYSAINIHGGKSGRSAELIAAIADLPDPVRHRLTLENDERAYGASDILSICQLASVPMVFDAHHHLVKERLDNYEDPSLAYFVQKARQTWPDPSWQMVHVSNGRLGLHDLAHHDLVTQMPSSFATVPWIEVEAKHKELAIAQLKAMAQPPAAQPT